MPVPNWAADQLVAEGQAGAGVARFPEHGDDLAQVKRRMEQNGVLVRYGDMPVLLLLVGMAVEITVLIAIGSAIGVLPTILLVIAATVVGAMLLRREGTRALLAFRSKIQSGQPPRAEMLDGVLIAVAGILVVLPGFVSDLVAIALLIPATRRMIAKRVLRRVEARQQQRPGQIFIVDAKP
ncbi:FxsA family protein [Actinocrispum sp. NPDC049592]|uniref:FxsA family protein n=1 Tax=Actinocrispum sp. NPDC049592 TaxID=3154835 RepID=UPI0034461F47